MSRWATFAPLNSVWKGLSFQLVDPIDVGCGVHLTRVPPWLRDEGITRLMSFPQREIYVGQADFALSLDYEADSLGDPDTAWTRQKGLSKQDVAAEKIR